MPELISWYLTELRLRLQKGFDKERVDAIVREAESHLLESAKRIEEAQHLGEDAAIRAALHAYGAPEKVAMTYLSRNPRKLFGLNPMWSVLIGGLVAISCWDFHWMSLSGFFDNFGATWENGLAGFIGLGGLALMAAGCRRGYRRYRLPILNLGVGVALFLIPFLCFQVVGAAPYHQGLSRLHLSRDIARVSQSVAKLELYKDFYRRGSLAFAKADSAVDLPDEFKNPKLVSRELGMSIEGGIPRNEDNAILIPYHGIFAEVDGRIWGVDETTVFVEAKNAWKERAALNMTAADNVKKELMGLLASGKEAQSGRLFFMNPDVYTEAVCWTLILIPGLLLFEWIAFLTSRPKAYWPGRVVA